MQKSRDSVSVDISSQYYTKYDDANPPTPSVIKVRGGQQTVTFSNPWPRFKGRGMDVGSNFSTVRDWWDTDGTVDKLFKSGTYRSYCSHWRPGGIPSFGSLRTELKITDAYTLDGMGATAIANTIPTNPSVDLAVAVGELVREGLPKMIGANLVSQKRADAVASEYLNYSFGIAPLISDVQDLAKTVLDQKAIIAQYERDSGRTIRRSYTFNPIGSTTMSRSSAFPQGAGFSTFGSRRGNLTVVRKEDRRVWFSGAYSYYLELPSGTRGQLERTAAIAKRLYGIRVDPSVIWNLMPWTWAIDWVTNAGDVMHNLGAFSQDGLVLRYGYIMSEQYIRYDRTMRDAVIYGIPTGRLSDSYGVRSKVRRRATPYGFGLDPDGFSGRQLSILAALGIARAASR
jgi:hypothetical protein